MDSILTLAILILLVINLFGLIYIYKRKQPDQNNNEQIFKDQVNSLKIILKNQSIIWLYEQRNCKRYDRSSY